MFYNLTDRQIATIREKLFPKETAADSFLKNVIVNDYGSDNGDNLIRVIFSLKDGLSNDASNKQFFKIFNNETAIKYMKFKIFEILSPAMKEEIKQTLSETKEISDLENIITKYGALSKDLSPALDFLGDKNNLDAHVKNANSNNSIDLVYDTTFLLARPKIDYFTLGAIFYLDKQEYIKNKKLEERFVDKRVLYGDLLLYSLYQNNKPVDYKPIQDLRLIKSIFKETGYLENILNTIVNGRGFDSLITTKDYTDNNKISLLNTNSENVKKTVDAGKEKLASKITKKTKTIFSSPFYSRNYDESLGFLFSINYQELINQNTSYGLLLARTDGKIDLINRCKISSIKILRRSLKKFKNNYVPVLDTNTVIVSSGEKQNSNIVSEIDTNNSLLKEINLKGNSNLDLRTFSVNDASLFKQTRGFYQYGVEMTVTNGINLFLSSSADSLLKDITNLKKYLEETNNIVRTIHSYETSNLTSYNPSVYTYSLSGSYDPQKNAFTPAFIENFDKPRGTEPSYKQIVSLAASDFANAVSILGVMKENKAILTNTIISLLDPRYTKAESITYFINTFEKLINQMRRLIKDNYNSDFTVEKWFDKQDELIDTTAPINVGYKFLDFRKRIGLGILTASDYNSKIISDINRYSTHPNLETVNGLINYLAPNQVITNNTVIDFTSLNENSGSVANNDYALTELDIKDLNNNGYNVGVNKEYFQPLQKSTDSKKWQIALNAGKLAKTFSLSVKNSLLPIKNIQQTTSVKNVDVNETELLLSISKHFNLTTKTYYNPSFNSYNDLQTKDYYPFHINILLDNKCRLFGVTDDYRKSIMLNSKFELLFNTLHSVEILEYDSLFNQTWSALTKQKISSLEKNGIYLCKLRNYKNSAIGIDGIDQIKLPIYDGYFLFENSGEFNISSGRLTKLVKG